MRNWVDWTENLPASQLLYLKDTGMYGIPTLILIAFEEEKVL